MKRLIFAVAVTALFAMSGAGVSRIPRNRKRARSNLSLVPRPLEGSKSLFADFLSFS